jgi:translation initiation factor 3 subunit J
MFNSLQRQKQELEEKRRKEREEEEMADMTPEEQVAERLRRKKLQEEADLKIGLDSLGLSPSSSSNLDSFNPTTKEEFAEFAEAISKTITQFKSKDEYVPFLDELVRNLCAGCEFVR